MGCFELVFVFLPSTILFILQYHVLTSTAQTYGDDYHFCLGGNYTANSPYQSNLNLLLSSLRNSFSNNRVIKNVYYNNTVGQNPDTVYGSFRCIGDFTSEVCKDCIDTVSQMIITNSRCSKSKQGFIWYDGCMLRYSDQYYFSIMQVEPTVTFWEDGNFTGENQDQFSQILGPLMNDLVTKAVSDNTLFATGEKPLKREKRIYGLVQCSFDLSNSSCSTCLRGAIPQIPDGKEGGIILRPSCNLRFALYPFFQSTGTATPNTEAKGKKSSKLVLIIVIISVIIVLSSITIWYFWFRRKKAMKHIDDVVDIQSVESLQFNFNTIRAATDNFSYANKLGEGGFGTVYKGTLSDGQEIAVKRLSRNSGQGDEEFKNEVVLVVKLQHRNLVKLLGFCLHGEERLLIYEFMPNASLDQFIFDPIKRTYLDWERRYTIIGGIARGLLYLHEDSRLRIVHRDLKASNVLLGADMNPKISDFGMARMFIMNQTQANTDRIVGTYGYMAPEYAMHGHFSVKSDVFSFGVLVLEILSGRKNNSFYGSEGAQDLLSYAWQHWKEGTTIEFLDSTLRECYSRIEVMRCIHIGLLCVQENVANRPTMASIVNKLNNNSVTLESPSSPPAFFVNTRKTHSNPLGDSESLTVDEASITELHPR